MFCEIEDDAAIFVSFDGGFVDFESPGEVILSGRSDDIRSGSRVNSPVDAELGKGFFDRLVVIGFVFFEEGAGSFEYVLAVFG